MRRFNNSLKAITTAVIDGMQQGSIDDDTKFNLVQKCRNIITRLGIDPDKLEEFGGEENEHTVMVNEDLSNEVVKLTEALGTSNTDNIKLINEFEIASNEIKTLNDGLGRAINEIAELKKAASETTEGFNPA